MSTFSKCLCVLQTDLLQLSRSVRNVPRLRSPRETPLLPLPMPRHPSAFLRTARVPGLFPQPLWRPALRLLSRLHRRGTIRLSLRLRQSSPLGPWSLRRLRSQYASLLFSTITTAGKKKKKEDLSRAFDRFASRSTFLQRNNGSRRASVRWRRTKRR